MLAFVPVAPATLSPRAEALSQRLSETIEQYRQQNPDLSGLEVRQATQLAASRAGGANAAAPLVLALAAGAFAAVMAFVLAMGKRSASAERWPVFMVIVGFAVVLAVVVALKRR